MDMFINPFPFGNTNGIIDTLTAGLVGICKTGPEVHEHIDEGLFRRLSFPTWTIADSAQKYIQSAVRLIDNHKERIRMRMELTGPEKVKKIFNGRPEIMGQMLYKELSKLRDANQT
jgi:predicted O-linked N-acetylglucosamine transferase (SPINDLY family)